MSMVMNERLRYLFVVLLFTGSVIHGAEGQCVDRFRPGLVAGITPGSTTMKVVSTRLGKPDDVVSSENGVVVEWLYQGGALLPAWVKSMNVVFNIRTQKTIRVEVIPKDGRLESINRSLGCPVRLYCYVPNAQSRQMNDAELCISSTVSECEWLAPSLGVYLRMPYRTVEAVEYWAGERVRRNTRRLVCSP